MTPEWLDELCEEYEDSWKRTEVELVSRIRQFLEPRALPQERQSQAFQALAEIDVERDWLWWRKWLNRAAGDRPANAEARSQLTVGPLRSEADHHEIADAVAASRPGTHIRVAAG